MTPGADLVFFLSPTNLFASVARVQASADLYIRPATLHVRSAGAADYYDAAGTEDYMMQMNVQHYVNDETSGKIIAGEIPARLYTGPYLKSIERSIPAPPREYYRASLTA